MSQFNKLKVFFILNILFVLFNEIVSDESIFQDMTPGEAQRFFGTKTVPKVELIETFETEISNETTMTHVRVRTISRRNMTTVLKFVEPELITPNTTGIWFAQHKPSAYNNVKYTPQPEILNRIDFDFFQNPEAGAALTFFKSSDDIGRCVRITFLDDSLLNWDFSTRRGQLEIVEIVVVPVDRAIGNDSIEIGIIDGEYVAKSLPIELWEPYLKRHTSNADNDTVDASVVTESTNFTEARNNASRLVLAVFKPPEGPEEFFRNAHGAQMPNSSNINPRKRRQSNTEADNKPDVVYPKVLISAAYGSVLKYTNVDDFVIGLIAYLNVVDMLYRQFDDPQVRLKITGIIIPRDEFATPYIARNTSTAQKLGGRAMIRRIQNFFRSEDMRFPFATYDVIMAMVKDPLIDRLKPDDNQTYEAWSDNGKGICHNDKRMAIVMYDMTVWGMMSFAEALVRCFDVDWIDNYEPEFEACSSEPFYMSFQKTDEGTTIGWSPCVSYHLKTFFRTNETSCMHQRPFGFSDEDRFWPGTWLNLFGQCQNKFPKLWNPCWVEDHCQVFGCRYRDKCIFTKRPPMDGTVREDGKRCFDQAWV